MTSLIIDLRGNGGGAFAVKPLVEHVIDEPLEAGFFLSQIWTRNHDAAPSREEALAAPRWSGWSIISFWNSVQEQGITNLLLYAEGYEAWVAAGLPTEAGP